MTLVFWIVMSYLLGAVPTSYLAGRVGAGIDLREHGSRNLGATNLYRVLGWRYAIPVGLFDMAKGFVPATVFAARVAPSPWIPLVLGLSAIMGHVFPVYLRFNGGKGVATAGGVVLGIAPVPTLISIAVWVLTLTATGFMSLASMLGAIVFPVAVVLVHPEQTHLVIVGAAIAGFIVFTHRANVARLFKGTESRFGRQHRREA